MIYILICLFERSNLNGSKENRHGRIIATNVITYEEHVFDSQKDAADKLGLHAANVSMCLSGVRKACKHWKFRYYDEEE